MFVKDYENNFSCYLPEEFSEIKKENYEAWGVAQGTLHYFVILDDEGEVEKAISINRMKPTETTEEWEKLVEDSVKEFEDFGFQINELEDLKLTDSMTVKRLTYLGDVNDYYVTYFAHLKDVNICSTISIANDYDEEETILAVMYSSIEEM